LGGAAIYAVSRLLEKWLEIHRGEITRQQIYKIWIESPKLGHELIQLEKVFSNVVIKQGMPDIRMIAKAGKSGYCRSYIRH
jgi:hypothetical protein